MDYELIKKYISKKKLTVKKVAHAIDMTESGLYRAFSNDSLTVNKLERIAEELGMSPRDFWPERPYSSAIAVEPGSDYKPEETDELDKRMKDAEKELKAIRELVEKKKKK